MDLTKGTQARFLVRISPVINDCCKAILTHDRKLEISKIDMLISEKIVGLDL